MTSTEAKSIMNRIKAGFTYNNLKEDGIEEEYYRFFLKQPYDATSYAVDKLLEGDTKNAPSLGLLMKTIKQSRQAVANVSNSEYCYVCNNKGYVLMKEQYDKLGGLYEYILHCVCHVGLSQAYKSADCKGEHKTNNIIPSAAQYFDDSVLSQMAKANKEAQKPLSFQQRQELKSMLKRFGLKMPELKSWEIDAEGADGSCPF